MMLSRWPAGDESRACEEARLDVARAAAELPKPPQRGDAYFATPAGQKFLAFHEFEAMEHLSSPPWYKRKDEKSDPACPTPLGFCPRNNSAGRAVDFMNKYGLPVLRHEADADHALLVLVASPRVGSTLLERLLDAAPDTTMHNEFFHWNDTQFGACGPHGGHSSHRRPPGCISQQRGAIGSADGATQLAPVSDAAREYSARLPS